MDKVYLAAAVDWQLRNCFVMIVHCYACMRHENQQEKESARQTKLKVQAVK